MRIFGMPTYPVAQRVGNGWAIMAQPNPNGHRVPRVGFWSTQARKCQRLVPDRFHYFTVAKQNIHLCTMYSDGVYNLIKVRGGRK